MRLRTPLTELVGVEHPVVQTGMGWVAGARLVSATANAGGLGILASATMTLDELATAIGKVKAATDKPFGVNIRADAADAPDRVELMIREGVKVASFALAPKQELISRLKEAGAVVIPSIGAAKHARKVASWGADAMIVQGGEGGGHTGPVATTLLLPSVLDAIAGTGIPVIAAGGFFDGRGLAAALSYGAAGVAMGTRFLLTSDSTVPDSVKRRYLESELNGTVVTTRVDGMPHRVLRTELVEKLEGGSRARGFTAAVRNAAKFKKMSQMSWRSMISDGLAMRHGKEMTWSQVLMAANTPMLLKAGLVDGNTGAGVLASGQVAGILNDLPSCAEVIESIVRDAVTHLQAATALVEERLCVSVWAHLRSDAHLAGCRVVLIARSLIIAAELEPLDDRDVGGAAALAHRLQPVATAGAFQLVEHGGEQLGAGGAERMTERDGATVGIDPLRVRLDLLEPSQHHRRERLVDLDDVDVFDRQAGLLQRVAGGRNRTGQHEYRISAARADVVDTGTRGQLVILDGLLGSQQHRAGAVGDLAGQRRRQPATFGQCGQPGHLLQGGVPRPLVEPEVVDRDDLVVEVPRADRRQRPLVARQSEPLHLLAGQIPALGDQFRTPELRDLLVTVAVLPALGLSGR